MKPFLYYLLLFSMFLLQGLLAQAQHLEVYMQNSAFLSTQTDSPYIETYITIPGETVTYMKNNNGKFEGALEVTLLYLRDSITVAAFDKYVLRSPESQKPQSAIIEIIINLAAPCIPKVIYI
jgi:hypothetical protein